MHQAGHKQKDIAQRLGVSPRMVRYYLSDTGTQPESEPRLSKLDPFLPALQSILEDDPFHNLVVIHQKLRSLGYDGGVSILRNRAATIRHGLIQKAVIRFETEPGRQAQVDWKEVGTWNLAGVPTKVYAFVMLLGYSRRPFVRFTTSMKSPTLVVDGIDASLYLRLQTDSARSRSLKRTDCSLNPALSHRSSTTATPTP